jgi:lipopolysaccharide export system permease protein
MSRLSFYLTRLFLAEALALIGVVTFLLYLLQTLRMFDLVSAKGQDLLTLAGQAALVMPPVSVIYLYVCIGIGLARALRALQGTRQLHMIHATQRLSGLFGAVAIYTLFFTLVVAAIANYFGPLADQRRLEWSASIAVDLVGRALVPHRFTEISPGVTIVIGGRQGVGEITDFFADDRRDPNNRQSFSAASAVILATDRGYVLQLKDGSAQYLGVNGEFSSISFDRYDLSLDVFAEAYGGAPQTSLEVIGDALAMGYWTRDAIHLLAQRNADGLRVIGICLIVAAIAGFPSGSRRRFGAPMELIVLAVAFIERGLSTYAPTFFVLAPATGSFALVLVGCLMLLWRLRSVRAPRMVAVPA